MGIGAVGDLLCIAGVAIFVGAILTWPALTLCGKMIDYVRRCKNNYDRPQPVVGPAKAMRAQGRHAEALEYLEELAANYPDLAIAFIEMIDLYITEYKDKNMAAEIYRRGMASVKGSDERRKLDEFYKESIKD